MKEPLRLLRKKIMGRVGILIILGMTGIFQAAAMAAAAPYVPGRPENAPPVTAPAARTASEAASVAPVIQQMTASEDPQVRARAMELWPLSTENEKDLSHAFSALQSPDSADRTAARDVLDQTPTAQLFAYVMRMLAWGEADQVRLVDTALPMVGPRIADLMAATLETEIEAERHRRVAAWALGRSGNTNHAALLSRYAEEGSHTLALTCAQALAMLRAPEALQTWVHLLEKDDPALHALAIDSLAELDTPPARQVLLDIARGEKKMGSRIEQQAVQKIASWNFQEAIPLLISIMEANADLSPYIARILSEKTGESFGSDVNAWREWWMPSTPAKQVPISPENQ